ncbi:MAG: PQQ-dependent sugar dehydrogenase, partial [Gammaproteobacteria bacterium]|nr:PQQ-dependent sugar dehydrogenase [Gammaproteobacteria bacterium]
MKKHFILFLILFFCFIPAHASVCQNQTTKIPDIKLHTIIEGIDAPVAIAHAGDGSGRLFVVEQHGIVRIIKNNQLMNKPFLDIRQKVKDGGEKGLLGIAFHPKFKSNGRFFLNYTANKDGLKTIIAEYRVNADGTAKTSSEIILLEITQPWGNHNGGQLAFGPDGY